MKIYQLTAIIAVALLAPGAWAAEQSAADSALSRTLNDSFANVFEKVAPSVVVIESENRVARPVQGLPRGLEFFLRQPDGEDRVEPAVGTGFIFRADGHIITNNHVIADAESITVRLKDGRKFSAEIVGVDESTDLAVLKIDAKDLVVADIGDSDKVRVGQFAFAIGTPMELPYTFTVGVVSAKNRDLSQQYGELIQTDASINPGNSGGPLSDIDGRVVGVNTLISGMNRGLGFAIPINVAKSIADQLADDGRVRRPWLGIAIAGIEEVPELRRVFPDVARGVLVRGIEPGAPAQLSDLQAGDVITKVDGVEVSLAIDLQRQILRKQIGQSVALDVWRRGKTVALNVKTGERPDFQQASIRPRRAVVPENGAPKAQPSSPGMSYRDATPALLNSMGMERQATGGVVVVEVEEGSAAAVAGIEKGDIITEAAGKPVLNSKDFDKILASDLVDEGALVLIERGGARTIAILKP